MNVNVDPSELLTEDEFDAAVIEDWFRVPDLDSPLPTSAAWETYEYAHENPAAWSLVDVAVLPDGVTLDQAQALMVQRARGNLRFNPHHDPKTGRFSSGGGTGGGAAKWVEVSHETLRTEIVDRLTDEYQSPSVSRERAHQLAEWTADRALTPDRRVFRKGEMEIDIASHTGMNDEKITALMAGIDHWQSIAPVPNLHLQVAHYSNMGRFVNGETEMYTGRVRLNSGLFNPMSTTNNVSSRDGWNMPAGVGVKKWQYTLAHEWGHTQEPWDILKHHVAVPPRSMSKYGLTNHDEMYAEAWTEWHLTNGQTANGAAKAYAAHFGWK